MKKALKLFVCILLVFCTVVWYGCGQDEWVAMQECRSCGSSQSADNSFCADCGKPLGTSSRSDSEALLGTWEAYDDPWGRFTYSFFADGYCMGEYWGHVGGVDPSLYPGSYYIGSGDGNWSFVQGELIPMLKVSYIGDSYGDQAGTQYYEYAFNEDYTELTIHGVDTYGDRARGSIVWRKISD